jgi:hypothetical protein
MRATLLPRRTAPGKPDDDQLGIAEPGLDALALVLGLGNRPLARP